MSALLDLRRRYCNIYKFPVSGQFRLWDAVTLPGWTSGSAQREYHTFWK
jgi:hypothetical protein